MASPPPRQWRLHRRRRLCRFPGALTDRSLARVAGLFARRALDDLRGDLNCPRGVPEERGDAWVRLQVGEILIRGQLRSVAVEVHHAEKSQWLVARGAKLVPGPRRHPDEVMRLKTSNLASDEALTAAVNDENRVRVLVSLE
jgi:hypothetical protein